VDSDEAVPVLTSDLDWWRVTLKGGEVVELRAHGVQETNDALVFQAIMEGSPAVIYDLAWIPLAVVEDWEGGWPTRRD
jgi:hypothetical protein